MSLHYLLKYVCQKKSEICIIINDKLQGSIAKHLRCDELLYYTFIIQSAGERMFHAAHCTFVLKDTDLTR